MEVTTKADNVLDVMEEKAETRDEVPVTVVSARYEGEEPLPNYTVFNFLGNKTWFFIKIFLLLFVIGYTIAVLLLDFRRGVPVLYIEIFFVSVFIIGLFFRKFEKSLQKIAKYSKSMSWQVSLGINFGILLICIVVAVVLSSDDYTRLFALLGLFAIVFLCYLFSWNRRKVSWRPVLWGFYLQFVFAVFILRTQAGETMFLFFGGQVQALLDYTKAGTSFVFGNALLELGGGPFALTVLPVIIFFSGITSVLFYWGVLQRFTLAIGNVMMFTLGTSAPESLSAAGNIFLGQTEAPLLIRPYLKFMTNSEIHAVMTGGFGTIAGGVLAAFISFGVPAEHLLAASVMSAPASLAISKLVYPETMKVDDSAIDKLDIGEHPTNALEAFTRGATISIGLLANIVVNLIAFLALIEFLNTVFAYFLTKLGNDEDNFTTIVGKIMSPFALLMGIPIEDMQLAGELLGNKIVANEFVAFLGLVGENGPDPKSKTFLILTYALCGFSNFSSIGIQLGALGIMAPNKLTAMSKMALSAMLCGNIACFMTACIAGVLLKNE